MRKIKKNREVSIINLSFMDLLTGALGGLAFILFFYVINYQVTVEENLLELKIITDEIPEIHLGQAINFSFSAQGGLEPYYWSLLNTENSNTSSKYWGLPKGLSFDNKKGTLSGEVLENPENTEVFPQEYYFTISVNVAEKNFSKYLESKNLSKKKKYDANKQKYLHKEKIFKLLVWPPKKVTNPIPIACILPSATINVEYKYHFNSIFGTTPLEWRLDINSISFSYNSKIIDLNALPTIDKMTGLFKWMPNHLGKISFDIMISDHYPINYNLIESKTKSFSIEVKQPVMEYFKPYVSTYKLAEGFRLRSYWSEISIIGGIPPFTFEMNNLPKNLNFSSLNNQYSCSIFGIPQKSEAKSIYVKATDSIGNTCDASIRLTINERATIITPLEITTKQSEIEQMNFYIEKKIDSFDIDVKGGNQNNLEWNIEIVPEHCGLKTKWYDPNKITGTPNMCGDFILKAKVNDGIDEDYKEFLLKIRSNNKFLTSETLQSGVVDKMYEDKISFTSACNPTVSLSSPPKWLSYEQSKNEIILTGKPNIPKKYEFNVSVRDEHNDEILNEINKTFIIEILDNKQNLNSSSGGNDTLIYGTGDIGDLFNNELLKLGCQLGYTHICVLPIAYKGNHYRAFASLSANFSSPTNELPEGLYIKNGLIEGIPEKVDKYDFSLNMKINNHVHKQKFKLEVKSVWSLVIDWIETQFYRIRNFFVNILSDSNESDNNHN